MRLQGNLSRSRWTALAIVPCNGDMHEVAQDRLHWRRGTADVPHNLLWHSAFQRPQ